MPYSSYYQVTIDRSRGWFVAAVMRSFEHLAFERSFDAQHGINEYFVPKDLENHFLAIVKELAKMGVVKEINKLPNRLQE